MRDNVVAFPGFIWDRHGGLFFAGKRYSSTTALFEELGEWSAAIERVVAWERRRFRQELETRTGGSAA